MKYTYLYIGVGIAIVIVGIFIVDQYNSTSVSQSNNNNLTSNQINSTVLQSKTWIQIDPIFCCPVFQFKTNAYSNYFSPTINSTNQTLGMIKEFYKIQGIEVFDFRYLNLNVCNLGECPDKYAFYVQVASSDVNKMMNEGLRDAKYTVLSNLPDEVQK